MLIATSVFSWDQWSAYFAAAPLFFQGFLFTIALSIGALILALALGALFGALSSLPKPFFNILSRCYVEFYQNTPLLVQFVTIYYGLPLVTNYVIMPNIYLTGILCVGLYHGAYIAEVIRTGIEAIPKGQTEAALSQGLTYNQTMRWIIIPQALRVILPPLTNQVVNLIKNTATVALISGADIMFVTKSWSAINGNYVPAFTGAALLYFLLCFPIALLGRHVEEKNKKAYNI